MSKISFIGGSLSFVWLLMAVLSTAQQSDNSSPAVLDIDGQPLQAGVQYYISPAITDVGGRFTLIDRNNSCPLYVGQENVDGPAGLPVIFTPFADGETVIREQRDFRIVFSAGTTCVQSTAWMVGEVDSRTQRRLIVTGESTYNYFRISKNTVNDVYNFDWCPTDVCPICRFNCGSLGSIVENGKRLSALDGSVVPVIFQKA